MNSKTVFLCLVLFFLNTSAAPTEQNVKLLPKPSGPFSVSINSMELIDTSRLDPFAPTKTPRKIMISAIYPVEHSSSTCPYPYMPSFTAAFEDEEYSLYSFPNGTYESLFLQTSCISNPRDDAPLVLFSPAQGNTRLDYSFLVSNVASYGFTVIMLDHPYDSDIVEFPDGSYIVAPPVNENAPLAQLEALAIAAIAARVQDASFVLDQLANETVVRHLIPGQNCALDASTVAMFGHSLGGAAAATAMVNETRIKGGLNMDGTIFGDVLETGLDRPFLLVGHTNNTRFYAGDDPDDAVPAASWLQFWSVLRGWKLELEFLGSLHYTFSDFPSLLETLGLKLNATQLVTLLSGGGEVAEADAVAVAASLLKAERGLDVVVEYVVAFLEFVLKGKKEVVLAGPSRGFPEVVFV